jgi:isopenicillin-N epimerase
MREHFLLDPDVVYLNHGSYGACPRPVFERYQAWQLELEREPVDFISNRLPGLLAQARATLAEYVGAQPDDLTFVPNATTGVNMAARAIELRPGDEVLSTDLEYGACDYTWEHVCERAGARYVRAPIAFPVENVTERLFARRTERTRAVYVSHITSETGLLLPVEEIVARARAEGLATIVDGAHAPGHVDLDLDALGADFYAGNCHKWLLAPTGAGFLYLGPGNEDRLSPLQVSWGWRSEGRPADEPDEYGSTPRLRRLEFEGTRDICPWLAVPAAIDFQAEIGLERIRARMRELAGHVRRRLSWLPPATPEHPDLCGAMTAFGPPEGADPAALRRGLWEGWRVEAPTVERPDRLLVRASTHFYNTEGQGQSHTEHSPASHPVTWDRSSLLDRFTSPSRARTAPAPVWRRCARRP